MLLLSSENVQSYAMFVTSKHVSVFSSYNVFWTPLTYNLDTHSWTII